MRRFIFLCFLFSNAAFGQNPKRSEIDMDRFVQDLFGQQTGNANYENIYEGVFQYYRTPLDLNKATREELENLYILSPFQINSLLNYIKKNGKLLTVYELQAVPSFDKPIIDKLLPFVTVPDDGLTSDARSLWKRIKDEDNNYAIFQYARTLEKQKGFGLPDTSANRFLGTPDRHYARYRIQQKNDFSIGITTEKDVGEQIAWNPARQQYGMDFYSGHFAIFNKGILKAAVVGDYQVQIGQGLVMSAGFYIGKGAEPVSTVKRSNQGIRPFSSVMEYGFLRGGAATLNFGRFDLTNFVSYRNLDGNVHPSLDTLQYSEDYTSSVLHTGLHRTASELANKGQLSEKIAGTHLLYSNKDKNLKIGVNSVYTRYDPTIQRIPRSYNQFDFQGKENYNFGADFSYNWQNMSFFGEYSRSKGGGNGLVAGVVSSLSSKIDVALLYRSYDPNFYSFYGNTFGEISTNRNERGIYWGLKYTPMRKLNFAAYFDKFSFPWLTIRSDAPTEGYEYMLRVNWMPTKKITLYVQYRDEIKQINKVNNTTNLDYIVSSDRRNFMINLDYYAEKIVSLKSRVQFTTYQQEGGNIENGIVILQDVNFDFKRFRISARFAIFDDQDYNTRIYVYEKTVLYGFSLPLYYGQGMRNYILLQYKVNKNIDIWLKLARFDYRNTNSISSGLNEIHGNSKTDVTMQVKYDF
jgi:hypothetical protein